MADIIHTLQSENLNELREILIKDPNRIGTVNEDNIGVHFLAARLGNLEIMQYIVENTLAKMDVKDPQERTCLHYAVESGNLSLVKYFVEKVGFSPLDGDKTGITPFQIAHENGLNKIESYFQEIVGCRFDDMYQNPIRTGMFADPSIVRVGEDYYMVNSTFVHFPCIPISHSKDLIHWEIIGHAITNPEWANLEGLQGGRGYWAPDISYNEGRYYITATLRLNDTGTVCRKQMVVSSEKPEGPYCKPSFIEEDGIDPSIFTDDDGRRYMLLNRGARIFEISKDGTKKLSEPKLLYYGHNKRATEGPHILKKDGWYYLFLAEGGTGRDHRISVARSKELFGNYEACPYNPIMTQKDSEAMLQCCGHGKPVMTSNGEWYIVYLCNRFIDGKYGFLGRETALDPITWTMDGWPIINNLMGPSVLQKKPKLPLYQMEISDLDDFDTEELSKEWFYPRIPMHNSIGIEDSHLCINGSINDLDSNVTCNAVLRRQTDFSFSMTVKMKIPTVKGEQNAGITNFYDENTYLKFGIYNKNDKDYELCVFEKIGEEKKYTFSAVIQKLDDIYLKITVDGLRRSFLYSYDGVEWIKVGVINNVYYLCSEGITLGKRFTGATVGMYAFGSDEDTKLIAEFDYFNYEPGDRG